MIFLLIILKMWKIISTILFPALVKNVEELFNVDTHTAYATSLGIVLFLFFINGSVIFYNEYYNKNTVVNSNVMFSRMPRTRRIRRRVRVRPPPTSRPREASA